MHSIHDSLKTSSNGLYSKLLQVERDALEALQVVSTLRTKSSSHDSALLFLGNSIDGTRQNVDTLEKEILSRDMCAGVLLNSNYKRENNDSNTILSPRGMEEPTSQISDLLQDMLGPRSFLPTMSAPMSPR